MTTEELEKAVNAALGKKAEEGKKQKVITTTGELEAWLKQTDRTLAECLQQISLQRPQDTVVLNIVGRAYEILDVLYEDMKPMQEVDQIKGWMQLLGFFRFPYPRKKEKES